MIVKKHTAVVLLLLLQFLLPGAFVVRADDTALEYKVKAAFLLNFAKFTTWPDTSFSKDSPRIDICIAGPDPFGSSLGDLESKQIGGKPIRVHRIPSLTHPAHCHVLFISRSERLNYRAYVTSLPEGVLTVSDIQGFAASGGIFEFITRNDRLSFKINNKMAKRQGLLISSSLLNLADKVL